MKKFYEIGSKTGLNAEELHKVARFGLFSLMAAGLTVLAGCFKTGKPASPEPEPAPRSSERTGSAAVQNPAGSIDTSTGAAEPEAGDNCGPYPGYPCGTRYYTVGVSDFKDAGSAAKGAESA